MRKRSDPTENVTQFELALQPITWATLQVLDGSTVLTPNEKRLLFKMWGFARQGRGCWASVNALADRLGLSERTTEDLRRSLRQLGILTNVRDGTRSTWYLVITPDCIPPDPQRLDADTFQRFRERVDNWLRFQRQRTTNPVRERGTYPVRERGGIEGELRKKRIPSPSSPRMRNVEKSRGETETVRDILERHLRK